MVTSQAKYVITLDFTLFLQTMAQRRNGCRHCQGLQGGSCLLVVTLKLGGLVDSIIRDQQHVKIPVHPIEQWIASSSKLSSFSARVDIKLLL